MCGDGCGAMGGLAVAAGTHGHARRRRGRHSPHEAHCRLHARPRPATARRHSRLGVHRSQQQRLRSRRGSRWRLDSGDGRAIGEEGGGAGCRRCEGGAVAVGRTTTAAAAAPVCSLHRHWPWQWGRHAQLGVHRNQQQRLRWRRVSKRRLDCGSGLAIDGDDGDAGCRGCGRGGEVKDRTAMAAAALRYQSCGLHRPWPRQCGQGARLGVHRSQQQQLR